MDHPVTILAYTAREAAEALGKTLLTFNRWIEDDLIPGPVLKDTSHGYRHYSRGEVEVMARVLAAHEREFTYYSPRHTATIEHMHQAMHGYRMTHI